MNARGAGREDGGIANGERGGGGEGWSRYNHGNACGRGLRGTGTAGRRRAALFPWRLPWQHNAGYTPSTESCPSVSQAVLLLKLVSKLDMFSHRAGVSVALATAGVPACIWLPCDVRFHVLCTIAGVVESLVAAVIVTYVWLLSCVCANVQLQVLQA